MTSAPVPATGPDAQTGVVVRWAVVLILVVVGLAIALTILRSSPLGWDEAVYASKARSLVTDTPASWFRIYRPPGLPILGLAAAPVGFAEAGLRGVTLALGLASLLMVFALARSVFEPVAGLLAIAAAVGSPAVLSELSLFHNDLPSAGLLLLLMLLLWTEFEHRPEPTRLLLAAGPIAAAAFYLRFGVVAAVAGIALASVLLWGNRMRASARLIGGTVVLGVVLLLPHLSQAVSATGSPIGILASAADNVEHAIALDSAVTYLRWFPVRLAGTASLLILATLVSLVLLLRPSRRASLTALDGRRFAWLLIPALAAFATVLVAGPEPRYVLFPLLLLIVGCSGVVVMGLGAWLRQASGRSRQLSVGVIVLLMLVQIAAVGYLARREIIRADRAAANGAWIAETGRAIAADAGGPCSVVTTIPPILGWNSGCVGLGFGPDPSTTIPTGSGEPTYVVFTPIDGRRAKAVALAPYRALTDASPVARIPNGQGEPVEIDRVTR